MEKYSFNERQIQQFFVPGGSFFNQKLIMFNCEDEIFDFVKNFNGVAVDDNYSSQVTIDSKVEENYKRLCEFCSDDIEKEILARVIVDSLVCKQAFETSGKQLPKYIPSNVMNIDSIIKSGTIDEIVDIYRSLPDSVFVSRYIAEAGINEVTFLCPDGIKNITLQTAINDYFWHSFPYIIKLFTSKSNLVYNFSFKGALIQPVHDYDYIDSKSYLKENLKSEEIDL